MSFQGDHYAASNQISPHLGCNYYACYYAGSSGFLLLHRWDFVLRSRSHHRARLHIHLHLPVEERNRIIFDPYYDIFAGIAFGTAITVVVSFGMIAIAGNLEGRRSSNANVPFVGSVKAELHNLYQRAQEWQSDAYLIGLTYNFGRQPTYPTYPAYEDDYILSADFRSLSEPDTSLTIEVSWAGKYLKNYSLHLPSSSNWQSPVSDKNWTIDSQEAVSIFAKDRAIRACLNLDHPKKLVLTQAPSLEKSRVIWCLRIRECYEIDEALCMDAVTGESVSLVQ
jgi:hypothetical protein